MLSFQSLVNFGGEIDWDMEEDDILKDIQYRGDKPSDSENENENDENNGDDGIIDIHDEMMDVFDSLGDELFSSGVTDAVTQMYEQKRQALTARNQALRKKLSTAQGVKLLDKVAFTIGVFNVALTGFIAGKFPQYMPYWYTLKFVVLVGVRFFRYRATRSHYFLLDFCYFANMLLMLSIWVFPDNLTLFNLCFAFSMGPLSWAILAWRNSLVFHSIDKMTSVFIHLGPPAVVHNIRWWAAHADDSNNAHQLCRAPGSCTISFFDATIWPLLPYLVWQVLYWVKVEYLDSKKVESRQYHTSFRYLVKNTKQTNSAIYRFCNQFGEKWQQPMFMVVQLGFTFVTLLPVKLFYDYDLIHLVFYLFCFAVSAWNGANFYFEVFSRKYNVALPKSLSGRKSRSRAGSRVLVQPQKVE